MEVDINYIKNEGTEMKRFVLGGLIICFTAGLLSGQSLVDLAKKEKTRRANLQGKKGLVITNADLKKVDKTAALVSTPNRAPNPTRPRLNSPAPSPTSRRPASSPKNQDIDNKPSTQSEEREDKWRKASQLVTLLTTKMNGLWQEFYSLDDMRDRADIQREISDTYLELQKAQQEASQLKDELDRKKT